MRYREIRLDPLFVYAPKTKIRDGKLCREILICNPDFLFFQEIFYLRELTTPRDILSLADSTVVMAGPGNVKGAKDKDFASLSLQVIDSSDPSFRHQSLNVFDVRWAVDETLAKNTKR